MTTEQTRCPIGDATKLTFCCTGSHDHHRRKHLPRPGIHPEPPGAQQWSRDKGRTLPEYLEAAEVRAPIAAAPHPRLNF